jgi:hypothetical protein
MDFKEVKYEGVEWIYLAKDRYKWQAFINTVKNLQIS